ncbi:hypothetical protein Bbelb_357500 [Branchiostoma belcheri]|nr:hypothetical protein Bbelb_357500 [Branchiostoma belcheri]
MNIDADSQPQISGKHLGYKSQGQGCRSRGAQINTPAELMYASGLYGIPAGGKLSGIQLPACSMYPRTLYNESLPVPARVVYHQTEPRSKFALSPLPCWRALTPPLDHQMDVLGPATVVVFIGGRFPCRYDVCCSSPGAFPGLPALCREAARAEQTPEQTGLLMPAAPGSQDRPIPKGRCCAVIS